MKQSCTLSQYVVCIRTCHTKNASTLFKRAKGEHTSNCHPTSGWSYYAYVVLLVLTFSAFILITFNFTNESHFVLILDSRNTGYDEEHNS